MLMANQIRVSSTIPSLRLYQFRFCKFLCTDGHPPPQLRKETSADQYVRELSMLLERGRTQEAKRLLKSLILRLDSPFASPSDLFSFSNTMLYACSESKLPEEATQLYALIRKEGFFPSLRSFNFFLQCLVSSGQYRNALHFSTEIISSGQYRVDKFTYGKAVQSAVKLGDLKMGLDLMNHMEMPDCFVYNLLIHGFCKQKRLEEAQKLFDEMLERNVEANCVTYTMLIDGYCKVGNLKEALNLLEKMKVGNVQPNFVTYSTLIDGYCKLGNLNEALNVCEKMKAENLQPNLVTYSMLVDGYCKLGNLDESLNVCEKMKAENLQPNLVTYSMLVDGYCKLGNLNEALNVCEKMKAENLQPDLVTYSMLIDGYCKLGNLNEALNLCEKMKAENLQPNLVTYSTLIDGYCKLGNLNEALNVCERMKEESVQPDLVTFHSLLGGLSRSEEMEDARKLLQRANELFDDLKARALIPGADSYTRLINGHCNIEDFDGGYVWYRKMLQSGFLPNNNTCNALVAGLRKLGRLEESERISSEMSSIKGSVKK